ncbi:unnamed protein product [Auanema sp. JU1783]|nr:unnamed protein product [Auanema sp. JU1783]
MSRGIDRESFVKGQLEAIHKALNKTELPLKPKHARSIILGTHTERSSNIFWNAVTRVQLEKHPVLTWKFCHLVHKLIRDGHRRVPEESYRYIPKIQSCGQFWKHLNTSGYGACIEYYSKVLCQRLEFHRRYPVVPGNLNLTDAQLKTLEKDLDNAFEMTIAMLDEMDNLLSLQALVYSTLECLRWSSLVPEGQCLLAPLILVILDTSKFYDYLVKMIFNLHSLVPPDALEGHRTRFREAFRKTKKFYEESSNLQYFKFLVSIPTLPAVAPNFLQASDLESYRTPHAYLHSEGPDDTTSVVEDTLLDLTMETAAPPPAIPENDPRDEQIVALQREIEDLKFANERFVANAKYRIEQYDNRLAQIQNEFDHARREADEIKEEKQRLAAELATRDSLRSESDDARVHEANEKAKLTDEKFAKMKTVYEKFRLEHLEALTTLGNLQKQMQECLKQKMDKEEELTVVSRRLEEAEKEKHSLMAQVAGESSVIDELRAQLARSDIELVELKQQLGNIIKSCLAMFSRCSEDLPNSTSISYPIHLAQSMLQVSTSMVSNLADDSTGSDTILAAHLLSNALFACSSAAYTASIPHYDGVNEQCKIVLNKAEAAFSVNPVNASSLSAELEKLNVLVAAVPIQSDIDKEVVGNELEAEMRRMDEAIKQAVEKIEAIQQKARENTKGVRLEVNESILATCQALMNAVMRLVAASRELQLEIVAAGRGGTSPAEFYKKNHQWTEGLLSAAKSVGVAANVLVAAADGVITGKGKFEELIVAAQEISASTAQLFVSSRVKADRDSQKLSTLSVASRDVYQCTVQVVGSIKSGQNTLNEKDVLDFSNLTLHDAKKEEMESKVRVLELEQALEMERARLRELRKQHFHMAEVANKDNANDKDNSFEILG